MKYEIVKAKIISDSLEYVLVDHLYNTLRKFRGNVADACEQLKMDSTTVYRWIKKHKIVIDCVKREVTWSYLERFKLANKIDEHIR